MKGRYLGPSQSEWHEKLDLVAHLRQDIPYSIFHHIDLLRWWQRPSGGEPIGWALVGLQYLGAEAIVCSGRCPRLGERLPGWREDCPQFADWRGLSIVHFGRLHGAAVQLEIPGVFYHWGRLWYHSTCTVCEP
jgi:hypothetical protein